MTDRFIEIYVGDAAEGEQTSPSLRVPASILKNLSKLLAGEVQGACDHATAKGQRKAKLFYPNDLTYAWEILLYWAFHHRLSDQHAATTDPRIFIDAWMLGHRWAIPDFQDFVMLELLHSCTNEGWDDTDIALVVDMAYDNPQSSLVRLATDVVVHEIEVTKRFTLKKVRKAWECGAFEYHLLKAYHRFHKYGEEIFDRFGKGETKKAWWKKFMIGEGPKQHWVYEKVAKGEGRKRQRTE